MSASESAASPGRHGSVRRVDQLPLRVGRGLRRAVTRVQLVLVASVVVVALAVGAWLGWGVAVLVALLAAGYLGWAVIWLIAIEPRLATRRLRAPQ